MMFRPGLIGSGSQAWRPTRELLARQIAKLGGAPASMSTSPTLTAGAANAAATLGGSPVLLTDSRIRYTGGAVGLGTGYPLSLFVSTLSLTFEDATRSGQLGAMEFSINCVAFEFRTHGAGTKYRIYVDGMLSANTITVANDGNLYWVKVDFTALSAEPVLREIRIEANSAGRFGGITPDASGVVFAPIHTAGLRMCVLGDSFTEGTGALTSYDGYAPQLAKLLGVRDFICSGFGGTGYITNKNPGFGSIRAKLTDRIVSDGSHAAADVYMIVMGINDPVGLTQAVVSCINTLRAARPASLIFIVATWNPSAPTPLSGTAATKQLEILAGQAARSGVFFIDVSGLTYTKSDATHPDQAGHNIIATSLAASSTAIIGAPITTSLPLSNASLPVIAGTMLDGQTVVCSPGEWVNSVTSLAYQWKLNGANISGQTSYAYAVQSGDLSGTLSCAVTATNADGSTTATSVGVTALYGPDLLLIGDFASSTGWTAIGGWEIADGKATHATGANGNLFHTMTGLAAGQYRVSMVVSGRTAGGINVQMASVNQGSGISANGAAAVIATVSTTNPVLNFFAGPTFDGSIDDVELRLVL